MYDIESLSVICAAIAVSFGALGPALAEGKAVAAAMEAIARQPEAGQKIQGAMIIGCGFIEALTIYALVVVLLFGFGIISIH